MRLTVAALLFFVVLIAETSAGLFPFALRTPLLAVLHAVDFTTLFRLTSRTSDRTAFDRET